MRPISPVRLSDISIDDANYVRSALSQIWHELPLLLIGSIAVLAAGAMPLLLALSGFPLLALIGGSFLLLPVWTGYCYMVGRDATHYKAYLGDLISAVVHYYWRSCLLAIPFAILFVAVNATVPMLATSMNVLVVAGISLQILALLAVCLLLIFAVPSLALFDLSWRESWSNSAVLVLKWPVAAIGLLSLAFLLTWGGRLIGPGGWLAMPLLFTPFQVNATMMLSKRYAILRSEKPQ